MGLSVRPRIGPNVLAIGDAAGSINPFNGEGIAYGYETGRLAAACVGRALSGEGIHALVDYESQLQAAYGLYYRIAREFVRLISRPELMRACVRTGHALAQRHGMAAAHHGQPGATRRDRPGRGRLPDAVHHRPPHAGLSARSAAAPQSWLTPMVRISRCTDQLVLGIEREHEIADRPHAWPAPARRTRPWRWITTVLV